MNSPICVNNIRVPHRKCVASPKIAGLLLAIAPMCLMLATTNTSQAQTTSSPADWTEFLRDNMQRWNPYETLIGVNNAGSLKLKWQNSMNVSQYTASSPAVVNGMAYLGSVDHSVYAFNATTGAKLWSFTTEGLVVSSPAVANGVVYIGSFGPSGTSTAICTR